MSNNKVYNNPIYFEKVKNNSLKVNFTNEHLIIGKSFFKNNNVYLNNTDKTIFYFMKNDKYNVMKNNKYNVIKNKNIML